MSASTWLPSPAHAFAAALRAERLARGHSQRTLAAASGLARMSLAQIEQGRYLPSAATAARLLDALGLTAGERAAFEARAYPPDPYCPQAVRWAPRWRPQPCGACGGAVLWDGELGAPCCLLCGRTAPGKEDRRALPLSR
jgi:transcriptional regulator with XRE-family HTH domain